MAYWFGDGFDLYTTLTDCGTYWDAAFGPSASLSLTTSGRFAGSRGVTTNGTNNTNPYLTKTSGVNDAIHHFVFAAQQITAFGSTNQVFNIQLFDGSTAQCSVVLLQNGSLVLQAGAIGATLATYTNAIAALNTWYAFEVEVAISNTAGYMNVRRNGNTSNDFSSATNLNTRATANNYANKIGIGCYQGAPFVQNIDDFLWRSDASAVAWVGDIRCYTRMPAADSSVAWSRSAATVPVTPFVQGSTQNSTNTVARFTPFTPNASGQVGTVTLLMNAADTGNLKCTIFASTGSAPGAVLGSATPLSNTLSGNITFTFGTPVSVTVGTQYWVGFITDTNVTGAWTITSSATVGLQQSSTSYASFPTASPATTATSALICTINVSPTGATANYSMVSEYQQDAAATYVYSSTVSQSDLYTLAPIGSTPAGVLAVTTRGYVQKSDAGTRLAAVQLQSGATNAQATPLALPAGSWAWNWRTDLTDPATGVAWTATSVNNALIGAIVTT